VARLLVPHVACHSARDDICLADLLATTLLHTCFGPHAYVSGRPAMLFTPAPYAR
jgi:hypothetical protein